MKSTDKLRDIASRLDVDQSIFGNVVGMIPAPSELGYPSESAFWLAVEARATGNWNDRHILADALRLIARQIDEREKRAVKLTDYDDEFVISVHCGRWTLGDIKIGEPSETSVEIERETIDADELQRYGRDYGISEASSSDPRSDPQHMWFNSTSPRMDREYIEKGVEKYYSLHIHEVNGYEPEAEDIQRIANLIGVTFDKPIVLDGSNDVFADDVGSGPR